jgi:hypothetical protein
VRHVLRTCPRTAGRRSRGAPRTAVGDLGARAPEPHNHAKRCIHSAPTLTPARGIDRYELVRRALTSSTSIAVNAIEG